MKATYQYLLPRRTNSKSKALTTITTATVEETHATAAAPKDVTGELMSPSSISTASLEHSRGGNVADTDDDDDDDDDVVWDVARASEDAAIRMYTFDAAVPLILDIMINMLLTDKPSDPVGYLHDALDDGGSVLRVARVVCERVIADPTTTERNGCAAFLEWTLNNDSCYRCLVLAANNNNNNNNNNTDTAVLDLLWCAMCVVVVERGAAGALRPRLVGALCNLSSIRQRGRRDDRTYEAMGAVALSVCGLLHQRHNARNRSVWTAASSADVLADEDTVVVDAINFLTNVVSDEDSQSVRCRLFADGDVVAMCFGIAVEYSASEVVKAAAVRCLGALFGARGYEDYVVANVATFPAKARFLLNISLCDSPDTLKDALRVAVAVASCGRDASMACVNAGMVGAAMYAIGGSNSVSASHSNTSNALDVVSSSSMPRAASCLSLSSGPALSAWPLVFDFVPPTAKADILSLSSAVCGVVRKERRFVLYHLQTGTKHRPPEVHGLVLDFIDALLTSAAEEPNCCARVCATASAEGIPQYLAFVGVRSPFMAVLRHRAHAVRDRLASMMVAVYPNARHTPNGYHHSSNTGRRSSHSSSNGVISAYAFGDSTASKKLLLE
eukprot:PhM_4_TR10342/c0_g1_i2/m.23534